jgi:medium-chain acyl-[acyl-carrier-protein] hydrolase
MSTAHSGGAAAAGSPTKVWFPYWRPKPEARVRLFCFPFAGGTASILQRWSQTGFEGVDVLAAQYPGHETRIQEPLFRSVPALVETLGPILRPLLDRPFAFFGYSLGTHVSLELAHWLQREGAPAPLGLMLAASVPAHRRQPRRVYALPEEALIEELRRYGGTPPQILAERELMQLILPVLRADFEMVDEYRRDPEPRLDLPLSVWGGQEDTDSPPKALESWRDHTRGHFALEVLPGGHFFLQTSGDKLREGMERTLRRWTAA